MFGRRAVDLYAKWSEDPPYKHLNIVWLTSGVSPQHPLADFLASRSWIEVIADCLPQTSLMSTCYWPLPGSRPVVAANEQPMGWIRRRAGVDSKLSMRYSIHMHAQAIFSSPFSMGKKDEILNLGRKGALGRARAA